MTDHATFERHARQGLRGAGLLALLALGELGLHAEAGLAPPADRRVVRDRWVRRVFEAALAVGGVELTITGEPVTTASAGRLVVANHQSIVDVAVLLRLFGGAVLSKASVARWPLLGRGARDAGTLFVERGQRASGHRAVAAMADRLRRHDTICVFPEGTTFVDEAVHAFRVGGFVAADRARVPVVPVGIGYGEPKIALYGDESFAAHLARLAGAERLHVHAAVGAALTHRPDESLVAFVARCRDAVRSLAEVARDVAVAEARRASGA